MSKCHYCGQDADTRPYGPKGAQVCFGCATSTPEREADARRNFLGQLDASGPVAVLDGSNVGPYPFEHSSAARATKGQ